MSLYIKGGGKRKGSERNHSFRDKTSIKLYFLSLFKYILSKIVCPNSTKIVIFVLIMGTVYSITFKFGI